MRASIFGLTAMLFVAPTALYADDDEEGEERGGSASVSNLLPASAGLTEYKAECGSCHLAYPPGMLPAASWASLLDGLADHFGQNAEIEPAVRQSLGPWLSKNAAESGSHPTSRKVMKSARGQSPLRISDLRFIRHEHDEVSAAIWKRPAVKTVANCSACHLDAEQWSFREHRIEIPR